MGGDRSVGTKATEKKAPDISVRTASPRSDHEPVLSCIFCAAASVLGCMLHRGHGWCMPEEEWMCGMAARKIPVAAMAATTTCIMRLCIKKMITFFIYWLNATACCPACFFLFFYFDLARSEGINSVVPVTCYL